MSDITFYPASTRGHANHGWLNAYHSFSFAGFFDPQRIQFGALRVLNDDTVSPGMGFGKHPHDNMEIITIITEGTLQHKDSMGHAEDLRKDEVQVMSAGKGVQHSEYNPDKESHVKLFQIWIFPDTQQVAPRYDQRAFDPAGRRNTLQELVSPIGKEDEGLKIHQNAWIHRISLDAGQPMEYALKDPANGLYVFNIEGTISVNGQELRRRDAAGIRNAEKVTLEATVDADLLLLEVPVKGFQ